MSDAQGTVINDLLAALVEAVVHHGDCMGADAEVHEEATYLGLETYGHPPTDERLRAFCLTTYSAEPRPYLERDRAIVEACDELLAAPAEALDPGHGGTWYTVRYARKVGRAVTVVLPRGTVTRYEARPLPRA